MYIYFFHNNKTYHKYIIIKLICIFLQINNTIKLMFFSIMHVYRVSTEGSILLYSSITHCVKSPHCIILLSPAVVPRTSYIRRFCLLHSAFRKHHGLKSSDKSCSTARKYVDITPKTRVRHALFLLKPLSRKCLHFIPK